MASSTETGSSCQPTLTSRQQLALETKDKIYQAAIRVINEKGYDHVSIEDITTEANVAKGSFYTHFNSKADIIFYNVQKSDCLYECAYRKAVAEQTEFVPLLMEFIHLSYTENEKRGKGIIRANIANYFSFPDYDFYNKDRALLRCLGQIVEFGKKEKVLDSTVPTDLYVEELLSTMIGAEVLWCYDNTGRTLVELLDNAFHLTTKGMIRN